jgi:hypothetical protein
MMDITNLIIFILCISCNYDLCWLEDIIIFLYTFKFIIFNNYQLFKINLLPFYFNVKKNTYAFLELYIFYIEIKIL